jgi:hypothetical protein
VAMRNKYWRAAAGGRTRLPKVSAGRRLGVAKPDRQRRSRSVASGVVRVGLGGTLVAVRNGGRQRQGAGAGWTAPAREAARA